MLRSLVATMTVAALCAPLASSWAADGEPSLIDSLRLETHGFVSFGNLRTWGNNVFADDTREGTSDFNEAALNVIARPWDRIRLGTQLFMRDLGRYDNGRVDIDWVYVDVQLHQLCDVQLGRVKIPFGLYSEIQDVDAARTPVFLPQAVYPTRLRELTMSVDGGKIAGRGELGAAGAISYTVFGGTKNFDEDGAYAAYTGEASRMTVTKLAVERVFGGTLQWDTPVPDLGVRGCMYQGRDFSVEGTTPFGAARLLTDTRSLAIALEWQPGDWTVALEYLNISTEGDFTVAAATQPYDFSYDGGYLSTTWHTTNWLELYAAAEYKHNHLRGRPISEGWGWIGAVNLMPLPHWSLKAEYEFQNNTVGVLGSDNPGGVAGHWHLLALKTTVDF